MECPVCGSEDIDLSANLRHVFECQECGETFIIDNEGPDNGF